MSTLRERRIVTACPLPQVSELQAQRPGAADYADAYSVACKRSIGIVEIFFAIFGHHPWWMKGALLARNVLASLVGLQTARAADILHPKTGSAFGVGDTIGPWPIFHRSESELVVGRDNRHLDFRVSLLRLPLNGPGQVTVSTVCKTHNAFGRIYLHTVVPFHRFGVPHLLAAAARGGRL